MSATARPATPADMADVVALRDKALAELRVLRGGELYVTRQATELPRGDEPDRGLWVGVLADGIVGYLSGRAIDRLGRIEAIYVDPECRAVGVGEVMIELALGWFREQRCFGVDATALPGARATKNFFEETGFTARLLVMHHELRPEH